MEGCAFRGVDSSCSRDLGLSLAQFLSHVLVGGLLGLQGLWEARLWPQVLDTPLPPARGPGGHRQHQRLDLSSPPVPSSNPHPPARQMESLGSRCRIPWLGDRNAGRPSP